MRPSAWAIVVLVIVVLLLFGANKLPEIAGSIGKSMKVFKKEVKELREDETPPTTPPATPAAPPAAPPAATGSPTPAPGPDQQPPGTGTTPQA